MKRNEFVRLYSDSPPSLNLPREPVYHRLMSRLCCNKSLKCTYNLAVKHQEMLTENTITLQAGNSHVINIALLH